MEKFGKPRGIVRIARLQMTLQPDGVQRHAGIPEFIHQPQQTAAHGQSDIVVALGLRLIQDQSGFLVDRGHPLEGAAHIACAESVVPGTEPVTAGRLVPRPERFVDDVP